MLRRLDLRDTGLSGAEVDYRTLVPRAGFDVDAALDVVRPICADVRQRGADAVIAATATYDGVHLDDIAVPQQAITDALVDLDPDVRGALTESIHRLRRTCEAEPEVDGLFERWYRASQPAAWKRPGGHPGKRAMDGGNSVSALAPITHRCYPPHRRFSPR